MPGPPPDVTTKRWFSDCRLKRPRGEQPRELPRVLVVARPLEGLAALAQFGLVLRVGLVHAARPQRLQRALGALAAVDPRRSEEDDGVLDLLLLESAQRLEVLGEDPDRPGLVAFEEVRVEIRERLLTYRANLPSECYDSASSTEELPPHDMSCHSGFSGCRRARRAADLRARRAAGAGRRRRCTRKASKRLVIKNAMVIYGNAKPPYGPVDIVVQDGLISYIGSTPDTLVERPTVAPTR